MSIKRIHLIAAAITLTAVTVIASVLAGMSSPPANAVASPLTQISTGGEPISLPPTGKETVNRINAAGAYGLKDAYLLGTIGSTDFYRLSGTTRSCYAVGSSADRGRLEGVSCNMEFGSSTRPVLAISIVEASKAAPELHFVTLQGVATDAIARIAALDDRGTVVGSTAVANNIFQIISFSGYATGLQAYDAQGNVRYHEQLPSS
jgi:hypothetical protein